MLRPYMVIFVDEIVAHFESNGFEVFVEPLEVETSTPHHPEKEPLLRTEAIVKWP